MPQQLSPQQLNYLAAHVLEQRGAPPTARNMSAIKQAFYDHPQLYQEALSRIGVGAAAYDTYTAQTPSPTALDPRFDAALEAAVRDGNGGDTTATEQRTAPDGVAGERIAPVTVGPAADVAASVQAAQRTQQRQPGATPVTDVPSQPQSVSAPNGGSGGSGGGGDTGSGDGTGGDDRGVSPVGVPIIAPLPPRQTRASQSSQAVTTIPRGVGDADVIDADFVEIPRQGQISQAEQDILAALEREERGLLPDGTLPDPQRSLPAPPRALPPPQGAPPSPDGNVAREVLDQGFRQAITQQGAAPQSGLNTPDQSSASTPTGTEAQDTGPAASRRVRESGEAATPDTASGVGQSQDTTQARSRNAPPRKSAATPAVQDITTPRGLKTARFVVDGRQFDLYPDGFLFNETDNLIERRPKVLERVVQFLKDNGRPKEANDVEQIIIRDRTNPLKKALEDALAKGLPAIRAR